MEHGTYGGDLAEKSGLTTSAAREQPSGFWHSRRCQWLNRTVLRLKHDVY